MPPGTYRLIAPCEGYGFRDLGEWRIGADGLREDIVLSTASLLRIRVLDPDGDPYEGQVSLRLTPKRPEWTSFGADFETDPKGELAFRLAIPGTCDVRLRVQGVGSAETLDATLGAEAELTLQLR